MRRSRHRGREGVVIYLAVGEDLVFPFWNWDMKVWYVVCTQDIMNGMGREGGEVYCDEVTKEARR